MPPKAPGISFKSNNMINQSLCEDTPNTTKRKQNLIEMIKQGSDRGVKIKLVKMKSHNAIETQHNTSQSSVGTAR